MHVRSTSWGLKLLNGIVLYMWPAIGKKNYNS